MDELLVECRVSCPYCGEPLQLLVDLSAGAQRYIEDCHVCCQPMQVDIALPPGAEAEIRVERSD